MKRWIAIALTSLLSTSAAACPLTDWLTQRYGVSFSGFTQPISKAKEPFLDPAASVRIVFPDATHVADGFRHTVVLDVASGKAWILRTGGFAGVREWYGPIDAPAMSTTTCRIEPAGTLTADKKRGLDAPLDWSLTRAQTGGGT
jgi:hypothetical protein